MRVLLQLGGWMGERNEKEYAVDVVDLEDLNLSLIEDASDLTDALYVAEPVLRLYAADRLAALAVAREEAIECGFEIVEWKDLLSELGLADDRRKREKCE